jgi:hypothetical protein
MREANGCVSVPIASPATKNCAERLQHWVRFSAHRRSRSLLTGCIIERKIQLEHIHPRFPEYAELPPLHMRYD